MDRVQNGAAFATYGRPAQISDSTLEDREVATFMTEIVQKDPRVQLQVSVKRLANQKAYFEALEIIEKEGGSGAFSFLLFQEVLIGFAECPDVNIVKHAKRVYDLFVRFVGKPSRYFFDYFLRAHFEKVPDAGAILDKCYAADPTPNPNIPTLRKICSVLLSHEFGKKRKHFTHLRDSRRLSAMITKTLLILMHEHDQPILQKLPKWLSKLQQNHKQPFSLSSKILLPVIAGTAYLTLPKETLKEWLKTEKYTMVVTIIREQLHTDAEISVATMQKTFFDLVELCDDSLKEEAADALFELFIHTIGFVPFSVQRKVRKMDSRVEYANQKEHALPYLLSLAVWNREIENEPSPASFVEHALQYFKILFAAAGRIPTNSELEVIEKIYLAFQQFIGYIPPAIHKKFVAAFPRYESDIKRLLDRYNISPRPKQHKELNQLIRYRLNQSEPFVPFIPPYSDSSITIESDYEAALTSLEEDYAHETDDSLLLKASSYFETLMLIAYKIYSGSNYPLPVICRLYSFFSKFLGYIPATVHKRFRSLLLEQEVVYTIDLTYSSSPPALRKEVFNAVIKIVKKKGDVMLENALTQDTLESLQDGYLVWLDHIGKLQDPAAKFQNLFHCSLYLCCFGREVNIQPIVEKIYRLYVECVGYVPFQVSTSLMRNFPDSYLSSLHDTIVPILVDRRYLPILEQIGRSLPSEFNIDIRAELGRMYLQVKYHNDRLNSHFQDMTYLLTGPVQVHPRAQRAGSSGDE